MLNEIWSVSTRSVINNPFSCVLVYNTLLYVLTYSSALNISHRAMFNSVQKVHDRANWSSSLVHNAAYFKHKGDKFPDAAYERYKVSITSITTVLY